MNEIEACLLRKEFNRVFPQHKIEEMLGHGNFGTAFLTIDYKMRNSQRALWSLKQILLLKEGLLLRYLGCPLVK